MFLIFFLLLQIFKFLIFLFQVKMVVEEAIHNIMGGIENTGTVKQHNHKKKLRQR